MERYYPQITRPVGNERAMVKKEQTEALKRGSMGLMTMDESSQKKINVAEDSLEVEKDKAESLKIQMHLNLFSMMRETEDAKKYLLIMRRKALKSLEPSEDVLENGLATTPAPIFGEQEVTAKSVLPSF